MDDISNRTLAILLIAAMVVSLGGTILSLNRLARFRAPSQQIAGYATGTGTANLSIITETTITVVENLIDFGEGVVNTTADCTNATLYSSHNDTNWTGANDICWVNSSSLTIKPAESDDIVIRNDGNINVTLTMSSSENDAATFIGGGVATPLYQYRAHSNETNACDNANNATWHDINSSATMAVCNKLKYDNDEDEVRVSIKVRIPSDATGYKEDTLTFTSS